MIRKLAKGVNDRKPLQSIFLKNNWSCTMGNLSFFSYFAKIFLFLLLSWSVPPPGDILYDYMDKTDPKYNSL